MEQHHQARWDDLALIVAAAAEARSMDEALEAVVRRLEGAVDAGSFAHADPDPWVTARRFARAHEVALRDARHLDAQVRDAVEESIELLSGLGSATTRVHGGSVATRSSRTEPICA